MAPKPPSLSWLYGKDIGGHTYFRIYLNVPFKTEALEVLKTITTYGSVVASALDTWSGSSASKTNDKVLEVVRKLCKYQFEKTETIRASLSF